MASKDRHIHSAVSRRSLLLGRCVVALVASTVLPACHPEWLVGDANGSCRHTGTGSSWQPGCALSRNLASVVDRPSDLYYPSREAPMDAIRRDNDMSAYHKGAVVSGAAKAGE